ncbi:HNH endonuclease [Pantoea agglomerans]|uniref:HNH endonuclease n=1 Tax=Enterobacter agglomerans TaxID=549 RepID=UPI0015FBFC77|nr:HNH endonuclease [Pantoea agglomerans]MBA8868320.1 hypothetical protein [Pantoea agglomerans]MBA8873321.1 hypothetical protein [Pantoea agglomerans]
MIKMTKGQEPQILLDNKQKWTKALFAQSPQERKLKPSVATKYRHEKVKAALIKETRGKCVYCESKILHVHHGDVEHILPKSLYEDQTFEWKNLTLACEICNQNKSNRDPNLEYIINPYIVDPELSINFAGSFMCTKDVAGANTKTIIDLNRTALLEKRMERIQAIDVIKNIILDLGREPIIRKVVLGDFIKNELCGKSEYSAMVKCFYELWKQDIPSELFQ